MGWLTLYSVIIWQLSKMDCDEEKKRISKWLYMLVTELMWSSHIRTLFRFSSLNCFIRSIFPIKFVFPGATDFTWSIALFKFSKLNIYMIELVESGIDFSWSFTHDKSTHWLSRRANKSASFGWWSSIATASEFILWKSLLISIQVSFFLLFPSRTDHVSNWV